MRDHAPTWPRNEDATFYDCNPDLIKISPLHEVNVQERVSSVGSNFTG